MGLESASTAVIALDARSAAGHQSASTVVSALDARSAVGREYASTVVGAIGARSAVGHKSASTVVGATDARNVQAHACDTTSPQSKHPPLPASVHRLSPHLTPGLAPTAAAHVKNIFCSCRFSTGL